VLGRRQLIEMEQTVRRLLLQYDSNALVAWLNGVSQDVLGWKLPQAISMYNESTSHYPVLISTTITYLLFIHGLQYYIRTRKVDLRSNMIVTRYAFLHNIFMSLISLYMFVDCAAHMYVDGAWSSLHGYFSLGPGGKPYQGVCDLFYWSKYLELIDTVILVLRGKELGFLHLFHHSTTGSVAYHTRYHPLWIGVWTNGLIHLFMYAHFAKPISVVRSSITTAQIVQFLIALMSYDGWFLFFSTRVPFKDIAYANMCYLVYLLFFIQFFLDNYVRPKKDKKVHAEQKGFKKEQ